MKKTKARAAELAVIAARDIIEQLYSTGVWEFEDVRIRDIAYSLNDSCITLGEIRKEEEGNDEEDA